VSVVGYYVGPTVDTALGDGTLLCYPWCYREWEQALIEDLIGDEAELLVAFGWRPSATLDYDYALAEVERQSVPLEDTEEVDSRPTCEACLERAVRTRTIDTLEPLPVALTPDGVVYEGALQIDDERIRAEWESLGGSLCRAGPDNLACCYALTGDPRYGPPNEILLMCPDCAVAAITPPHLGEYRVAGSQPIEGDEEAACDGWCGGDLGGASSSSDEEWVER
jgi:hypothetical protein